jgi:hypothetical protein
LAALALLFPAATTTVTPEETVEATAELTAVDLEPPRDMERTDFLERPREAALVATHWMPEMTPELVPEPEASRTFTATRVALLETP